MQDPVYRIVNRVGRLALRALAVDVRWSGVEHVPTEGPVLLAATHVSFPDFVLVERAAVTRGRLVRFLTRYDAWEVPVVPWFMDRMRHVPVDRQAPAHAYLRARELLRDGEAVCSFPEAGVSHSFTVRPLMRGPVALARETGAPLVPVAIWGSQRLYSVDRAGRSADWTRGRRVDLAFGAPSYVGAGDDLTERTIELGHTLTDLLEGLQRMPEHRPRPGEVATWYPAHLGGRAPSRCEALLLDQVPLNAVLPTWGPTPEVFRDVSRRAPDANG